MRKSNSGSRNVLNSSLMRAGTMSPPSGDLHNVLPVNRPDAIPDENNITVQGNLEKSQTTAAVEPAFSFRGEGPPSPDGQQPRVKMFHAKRGEMVSNEVIGRRLLNVREAAQYLGLEVDTVYKKSRLREVPCVKVGRALRFDVKALERYIEQHTIETID
jgi:excisionase family DNA binding protein